MIETKFKETEIGRIPEDWEVTSLSKISEVKTGPFGSALHASDYVLNGTPIITVEHLGDIHIDTSKEIPNVDNKAYNRLSAYMLKTGDVVFSRVGAVDRCSCVFPNEEGWLFSSRLLRVRVKRNINSEYLTWQLSTNQARKRILSVAVGLAMPSINSKILKELKVVVPSSSIEQTRIASALTSIDNLISSLDKLIEKKKNIKQGVMQQILTGKKRLKGFSEPWKRTFFNDIYNYASEGGTPTTSNDDYYSGSIPFAKIEDTVKKYLISTNTTISELGLKNSAAWIIPSGNLLFTNGATIGNVAINKIPVCTKQGIIGLIIKDVYDVEYLYYLLSSDNFQKEVHAREAKGTFATIILKNLNNIPIVVPSLKEQTAIASILTTMDNEIDALEAKKVKYEQIKQGMMQQLLTGKIRLLETKSKVKTTFANVYFRRSVLAAEIADRLCEEPTFGHVKMVKMLFLTERLCHLDIDSHYHRDAAGPYDNRALRSIDGQLKKQKWFQIQRTEKGNRYVPMQCRGKHKSYFDNYYSHVLPTFDKVINTFKTQRTEQCEIIATLYSAWEDLLQCNKPFTDTDIVNEVLNNWHESKKRISHERWQNAINWMRENGFTPK